MESPLSSEKIRCQYANIQPTKSPEREKINGRFFRSQDSLLDSPERRNAEMRCRFGPREYVTSFFQRLSSFIELAPGQMQKTNQTIPLSFNIGELFKREHDCISCVKWRDGLYYVSGTDIVKVVRTIYTILTDSPEPPSKKFEEGVFSDLRNFKTGDRARLEDSKSDLLSFMHRNKCIRTQKKQRVFYWLFWTDYIKLFELANTRDTKRISVKTQNFMMSKMQCDVYNPVGFIGRNNTLSHTPSTPSSPYIKNSFYQKEDPFFEKCFKNIDQQLQSDEALSNILDNCFFGEKKSEENIKTVQDEFDDIFSFDKSFLQRP